MLLEENLELTAASFMVIMQTENDVPGICQVYNDEIKIYPNYVTY